MLLPRVIFLLLILLTPGWPTQAGQVITMDAKLLEGTVALDGSLRIVVTPTSGPAVRLALDDIFRADMRPPDPALKWVARDIGSPGPAGSTRAEEQTLTLRGAGADVLGAEGDQFHFAYLTLKGDCRIIGKINSLGRSHAQALGGVMIRASLDGGSPYALLAAQPDNRAVAAFRTRTRQTAQLTGFEMALPSFVRLTRQGELCSAAVSADGQDWREVASERLTLPEQFYVGFFACSHNRTALTSAVFERVTAGAPVATANVVKGLVLRDGSELACRIVRAGESVVHVSRPGDADLAVPLSEIARVVYNAPSRPAPLPRGQGVWLTGGDFFESSIVSLTESRVRASSILFGLRNFEAAAIATVSLREADGVPTRHEVVLADGSVLRTDKLTVDKDVVTAALRSVEAVHFNLREVAEVRAGSARRTPLTALRPLGGDIRTVDDPDGRGPALQLAAGAAGTYGLDGTWRLLALRLAVPRELAATESVRLVVLADGRELWRSGARSSLHDALAVVVPLAGARELALRLEPSGGAGGAALLLEAALLK
jgi:hypothetical protein